MNRDDMIEVARNAIVVSIWTNFYGEIAESSTLAASAGVIDALIAANIIPDPETTVTVNRERLARLVEYVSWHREYDRLTLDFCDDREAWRKNDERGQRALAALTFGDLYPIPDTTTPEAEAPGAALGDDQSPD